MAAGLTVTLPGPGTPGNHAELVVDGPAVRAALLDLVAGAARQVHLASFVFRPDEAGWAVAAALAERARAGVEVRVLLDPTQSGSGLFADDAGGGARRAVAELVEHLTASGVIVRPMRPGGRRPVVLGAPVDHRKLVVVDGTRALVPSFGIGTTYLYAEGTPSGRTRWHDAGTLLRGPVVTELAAVFLRMWRRYGGRDPVATVARPAEAGDHLVTVLDVADPGPANPIRALYAGLVAAAEREVLVENAYVSDAAVLEAWAAAAGPNGPSVTLVRPGPTVSDYVPPRTPGHDRFAAWTLRRHDPGLLAAGVEVREAEAFVHLKLAVVDATTSIHGSYNLTYRSALLDPELVVVVRGPRHPRQARDLLAADAAAATRSPGPGPLAPPLRVAVAALQRRLG